LSSFLRKSQLSYSALDLRREERFGEADVLRHDDEEPLPDVLLVAVVVELAHEVERALFVAPADGTSGARTLSSFQSWP
jgi:hypothetical protein